MSGYILCRVPRAKVPYYLECVSMNIYSIEELCYFFQNNPALLDSSVLNEGLFVWLRDALGLKGLYQKLHATGDKNLPLQEYVYPIFKEINYLSQGELKEYERKVSELERKPEYLRMKLKGDSLMENDIYVNALKVYQELIRSYWDSEEVEASFLGSVYHNAGCAYSYLFQKEEALECFEKAYEKLHTGKALRSYLYAFYLARTPIEYMSKLAEMGIDEQTRKEVQTAINSIENSDQPAILDHQIDGMLENMIREYHRSTGA